MQRPVTAYFNARKRHASEDIRSKAKVLLLDQDSKQVKSSIEISANSVTSELIEERARMGTSPKKSVNSKKESVIRSTKVNNAVRNIQFDSPKANEKPTRMTRSRAVPSKKLFDQDSRVDIRESFAKLKNDIDAKKVLFEKKGALSPKKVNRTPKKEAPDGVKEEIAPGCTTPKKIPTMERLAKQDLSLDEIKNRINKSSRLAELKASIARFKNCDKQLEQLQQRTETSPEKPRIRKFEQIQLEIPVSPQKACKSPSKVMSLKKEEHPNTVSPQRRILFEPKETPASPIKGSPTKAPAYQRYLSLAESETRALPLPYKYRCLAEVFSSMDTVSAMLYNRKETITFGKLKPAIQELLRRNFTLEQLAQINAIYPNAYTFRQEKLHSIGVMSKHEKYELVLTPVLEKDNKQDDTNNESNMGPAIMLKRKREFYNALLERVKNEHEKFLLSLDTPMVIPKEKIMRWHPEFDVDNCKDIELSELPQPPNVSKPSSAKDVLEKAMSMYNVNKRMEKSLQKISEGIIASEDKSIQTVLTNSEAKDNIPKVDITVVDTPPSTPTTQNSYLTTAFKGIPKALLEKVRAKQAAKALEAMTRTPGANKEAALYARLPELAKILRNIFVAEKKGVLALEFVITKLDNSFRTKLTAVELEELIRLLCKLLPTWTSIQNVRKVDYLKLAKDVDLNKVIKRLQILANDKVTIS